MSFRISKLRQPPCFNGGEQCPRRCIGCHSVCDEWAKYESEKAAYYADKISSRASEFVENTPAYRSRKRNEQRLKSSGRLGK